VDTAAVIAAHRRAGREFLAGGVRSFVREEGAAVDALGLDRFHLVVHDIGGPVGLDLAAAAPARIRSLTVLNTPIEVDHFRRPWVMRPFAWPVAGRLWLGAMSPRLFVGLMRWIGVADRSVPAVELAAYVDLLKRGDGGAAFLRIMRGFELTAQRRRRCESALRDVPYPVQIVWGDRDPALRLAVHGRQAVRAAGGAPLRTVPAKHFLPEDQAPAIAESVAALAAHQ
jgi:haloalkane dehalogenase